VSVAALRVAAALLAWTLFAAPACFADAEAASHYSERPEVQAFAHEMAERHQMKESRVLRLMKQAVPQPSVLRAIAPPADPQRRSWTDYRALFVNDVRIDGGVAFWESHAATLARARAEFGVPEEIIVALIGIETVYGRNAGKYRVLDALATLAFDYPPRAEYFRSELEQFLLLTQESGVDPLSVKGSYAGAIGIPQFMPGSIRRFALDYSGDGQVDLVGNADDAIGSIANFLSRQGWVRDLSIAWPASVAGNDFQGLLDAGVKPQFKLPELAAHGATVAQTTAGPPEDSLLALIDLPSRTAPTEYRVGSQNFFVITRYNRSSFYATAAAELAAELRARRDVRPR
jgi:membrane-bound lytic murein transglycosylase B